MEAALALTTKILSEAAMLDLDSRAGAEKIMMSSSDWKSCEQGQLALREKAISERVDSPFKLFSTFIFPQLSATGDLTFPRKACFISHIFSNRSKVMWSSQTGQVSKVAGQVALA